MIKVSEGELELGVSSYFDLVQGGEIVIICRNDEPIAECVL